MKVGEVICGDESITLNTGRATKRHPGHQQGRPPRAGR